MDRTIIRTTICNLPNRMDPGLPPGPIRSVLYLDLVRTDESFPPDSTAAALSHLTARAFRQVKEDCLAACNVLPEPKPAQPGAAWHVAKLRW
jgi:hypothetical protein